MTIDSMFIFVLFAVGFICLILGHTLKIGLFNMISVTFFIALIVILAEFIPVVIGLVGLIIFEIYYTFWGDR